MHPSKFNSSAGKYLKQTSAATADLTQFQCALESVPGKPIPSYVYNVEHDSCGKLLTETKFNHDRSRQQHERPCKNLKTLLFDKIDFRKREFVGTVDL